MRMSKNIVSSRAVHAAFCVLFVAVLCGGSIPLADLEDVRDVLRARKTEDNQNRYVLGRAFRQSGQRRRTA